MEWMHECNTNKCMNGMNKWMEIMHEWNECTNVQNGWMEWMHEWINNEWELLNNE